MCGFLALLSAFVTQAAGAGHRHVLNRHVPAVARRLVAVGNLPDSTALDLSLGLPLRNQAGLTQLLEDLYDPASPLYHRFLTPEEFTARFGPAQSDYEALIRFAQAHRFAVTGTHANRLLLEVRGSVADIQKAFATRLKEYRHPAENRRFFAPVVEPSVDAAVPLLDISGLDDYQPPHPMDLRPAAVDPAPSPNAGSAPGGSYRGNDFRAAYAPGVALRGTGQSVGVVEFDGYYANDIATYQTEAGLPNVTLQNVLLNGFSGTAGPNNAEVALDIEVAIAMAPGLSSVLVYEGTSANTILNRMATDNRAKQLSCSWTFGINATTENIFRQFAAQGQSMFQASGDDGAYPGAVPAPADDPNLTVVGGTILSTSGALGPWTSETTWNWALTGMGSNASSGGVSATYSIPSYQKGVDMSRNQGSTTFRNIPDVAMTADNIWVIWDNGSKGAFGGTSAAAPLWAGFMALVNQQALANTGSPIGALNPALYTIGKSTNYPACLHDITTGNNYNSASPARFVAVQGYDLCTGWGTPTGQPLINALAGGTNLPPSFIRNPFPGPLANVGQPCSGSISNQATDSNPGERLSFAKLGGPAWLSVAVDGSLVGSPRQADIGTNAFVVSVSEPAGMSNTATMYLAVNGAPAFLSNSISGPPVTAGQAYSASIAGQATDPNPGDVLRFNKLSGPAWMAVSASGALSGTPAAADAGTNAFTLQVTDSGGLSAAATLYLDVNAPPSFSSNPFTAPAVNIGQTYLASLSAEARDPNPNASLSFSKLSGPGWLSVSSDGTLSGTPASTDAGTNSFSVMVSDSQGLAATATMNVPVFAPAGVGLHAFWRGDLLVLDWAGGNPPFQVQVSTNFAAKTWQDLGSPVTNRSVSVVPTGPTAAYRLRATP